MMTENMDKFFHHHYQCTQTQQDKYHSIDTKTYRVKVDALGRCGFPTVGIPLFLP
jgi:hypothetical protein